MRYIILHADTKFHDSMYEFIRKLDELQQIIKLGDKSPLIVHRSTNQITYVVKGIGKVAIDGDINVVSKGDLCVIPSNSSHAFISDDEMILYHYHWPQCKLDTDREVLENDFSEW